MNEKPSVAIVGAGRVGTALGRLLHKHGYPIRGVISRTVEQARLRVGQIGAGAPFADVATGVGNARIVLVTVPDDRVRDVAKQVRSARAFAEGDLLVHTSGVLPAAVLRGHPADGGPLCLAMHPIQSVADPITGADRLVGASFGLEGDAAAVETGERIVRDIGGTPLRLPSSDKALYHAAACLASNYLVGLLDAAATLLERSGIGRQAALSALAPLVAATLGNALEMGVPQALTGPIDRGDADTVKRHLDALGTLTAPGDAIATIYRSMGLYTLGLARAKRGDVDPGHDLIERMLT